MTEPVTNPSEIEDVLSSIRRLVAEDGQSRKVRKNPAVKAPADHDPSAFVLTTDQRVEAEVMPLRPHQDDSEAEAKLDQRDTDRLEASLEDDADHVFDVWTAEDFANAAAVSDVDENEASEAEGPNTASDPATVAATAASDTTTQADEKPAGATVNALSDFDRPAFVHESFHTLDPSEFEEELDRSLDESAWDQDAAVTASAPQIDEEMLKEIVADLVRKELQGAMGEKITRNVRKLVRREIQRAIAAQDFT